MVRSFMLRILHLETSCRDNLCLRRTLSSLSGVFFGLLSHMSGFQGWAGSQLGGGNHCSQLVTSSSPCSCGTDAVTLWALDISAPSSPGAQPHRLSQGKKGLRVWALLMIPPSQGSCVHRPTCTSNVCINSAFLLIFSRGLSRDLDQGLATFLWMARWCTSEPAGHTRHHTPRLCCAAPMQHRNVWVQLCCNRPSHAFRRGPEATFPLSGGLLPRSQVSTLFVGMVSSSMN